MKDIRENIKQSRVQASERHPFRRINQIRTGVKAGDYEYVDPSGQMKVIDYGPGLSPRM
jgi:hypothetical protein